MKTTKNVEVEKVPVNKKQVRTLKFKAVYVADVRVTYSLGDMCRDVDAAFERCVGRRCEGSGGGFGGRDLHWSFIDAKKAEKVAAKLKKLKVKGVRHKVSLAYVPDDEKMEYNYYVEVTFHPSGKVTMKEV